MKSQIILKLVFRYWFFAWIFYFILKHGPFALNLEINKEKVDNEAFIDLCLKIICIFWIVTIPAIFINSLRNFNKSIDK